MLDLNDEITHENGRTYRVVRVETITRTVIVDGRLAERTGRYLTVESLDVASGEYFHDIQFLTLGF